MRYYHTDDPKMVQWLANVMQRAADQGLSVRLHTDSFNRLKVKIGGGGWTSPFESTEDPFRDQSQPEPEPDTDDGMTCPKCKGTEGMHYLDCDAFAWL